MKPVRWTTVREAIVVIVAAFVITASLAWTHTEHHAIKTTIHTHAGLPSHPEIGRHIMDIEAFLEANHGYRPLDWPKENAQ